MTTRVMRMMIHESVATNATNGPLPCPLGDTTGYSFPLVNLGDKHHDEREHHGEMEEQNSFTYQN